MRRHDYLRCGAACLGAPLGMATESASHHAAPIRELPTYSSRFEREYAGDVAFAVEATCVVHADRMAQGDPSVADTPAPRTSSRQHPAPTLTLMTEDATQAQAETAQSSCCRFCDPTSSKCPASSSWRASVSAAGKVVRVVRTPRGIVADCWIAAIDLYDRCHG